MRKLILLCLLLPALLPAQVQWNVVYSNPNHNLIDIQFTSPLIGYVAGYKNSNLSSFVLKTTDGGLTWNPVATLSLPYLHKMHFLNDSIGYLSKGSAPMQFARTSDGGVNWSIGSLPDSCFTTQGLAAINDSVGYYINNAGQFRRFYNNGTAITRISDTLGFGTPIVFPHPSTGYFSHGTEMYRTSNYGQTWSVLPTNLTDGITAYAFTDTLTGYAVTNNGVSGVIVKTTNGAQSWQLADNFYAIAVAAHQQLVMTVTDTSAIHWSSNGGLTWTTETTGVPHTGVETYVPHISPGNDAFLINGYGGQIMRRSLPLSSGSGIETGISEVTVFPNPSSGWFEVRTGSAEQTKINIRTLTGQTVRSTVTRGRVETTGLAAGCYLVEITQADRHCIKKLVVN